MQLKHMFSFLPTKNVLNIKALKTTTTTNNPLLPHLLIQSSCKTNLMIMMIGIILITDQTVQPSRQETVQVNFHLHCF